MMTNPQLATASFNDIVFDGRNKSYGAYELRRLYQRHVSRALVIATTIFALLVFSPVVAGYLKDKTPVATKRDIPWDRPYEPLPLEPPVVVRPAPPVAVRPATPPPPARTIKNTDFRVTPDKEATEKVPDAKDLLTSRLGTKTIEGPPAPAVETEFPLVEPPKVTEGVVGPPAPYTWVEQMPELPGGGGVAAIVAAIQKAARYPSRALSAGLEGRVYVSFTVNAQGEVVDVQVVKGLGGGLDEETIRAIKTLPRFIPGKQNGREVSVSYTVPVTFKME